MPRRTVSVPTNASLPHAHRLAPDSPDVARALSRLTRESLIQLARDWLRKKNREFCAPYLTADHDHALDGAADEAPYEPAQSYDELDEIYKELATRNGGRKEIVERIIEGDWRRGISLFQLAMAEARYLSEHPNSLKWNAMCLVRVNHAGEPEQWDDLEHGENQLPRFYPQTFLLNLINQVSPLLKGHFYIARIPEYPILLLRVYIHDSPYNSQKSLQVQTSAKKAASEGSRSLYLAFPEGSPFVYVSLALNMSRSVRPDSVSLRQVVLDAVPKAFSTTTKRYTLQSTSLSTKNLGALISLRGPGRSNCAAGGWGIFAQGSADHGALDYSTNSRDQASEDDAGNKENADPVEPTSRKRGRASLASPASKRAKMIAKGRFGSSALEGDNEGLDRLEIRIDDPFPGRSSSGPPPSATARSHAAAQSSSDGPSQSKRNKGRNTRTSLLDDVPSSTTTTYGDDPARPSADWRPDVRFTFQGPHVFAGVRQLVEEGVVDGEKMPAWMTGEAGVSIGVVRDGRILTKN